MITTFSSGAIQNSFLFSTLVLLFSQCTVKTETQSDAALSDFEIANGFNIELIASEPLLGDPVDMEIDENGRLYVVEMPGYPLDISGSGSVKILTDSDGDGKMDKSVTFADKLILPNSVMRWKKGILVTDAPNVLYFEDTNNDDVADVRDTVLTGFALSNPQHNLNSPVYAIDNWIYLGHESSVSTETYEKEFGDEGSEVYFPGKTDAVRLQKNANGRAVRFKPDQLQLEVLSSDTQFGHTFDEWGHHLLVSNADHIFHEVIAEPYLSRNPDLTVSDATQSISDHGGAAEVFPITQNPQHQLLTDVGVITSACGLTAYLGGAFPDDFNTHTTFVAEPVSNLIHVDRISDHGSTFKASRIFEHREFLASKDPKFRPVNLYVGPDGALYVVDYYRQIIEHPEWMGEEVIKSGELYNDVDKGRIYRITASGSGKAEWTKGLSLGQASNAELVNNLANPNIWWRINAQRILIDRKAADVLDALAAMIKNSSPTARLHALWTLEGLGMLNPQHIKVAFADGEAGVRENAIKLSEPFLATDPSLVQMLMSLSSDPNPKVRFQALCTLGGVISDQAHQARTSILLQDAEDEWFHIAALSSKGDHTRMLDEIIKAYQSKPSYNTVIARTVSVIANSGNRNSIGKLIKNVSHDVYPREVQAGILNGLAEGAKNRKIELTVKDQDAFVQKFFSDSSSSVRQAILKFLGSSELTKSPTLKFALQNATAMANDRNRKSSERAMAIDFQAFDRNSAYTGKATEFLVATEPLDVQLAALRMLSERTHTEISSYLVGHWKELTPQIHDAAIRTFFRSDDRIKILLDAIDERKIPAAEISWPRRVSLMAQSDPILKSRARKIFTQSDTVNQNREFKEVLTMKGSDANGEKVYQKNCAICHQVRGKQGIEIGPDLGTIHNWSPESIMSNILLPNQSISSGYDLWSVNLVNGSTTQGIIASETPGAITLRNYGNQDQQIARKEIKSLRALGMSIMPDDFAKKITKQEMADLLAYLKKNK